MTQSLAPIVFDKTSAPSGDCPLWLYCVIPAGQALPRAPGVDLFAVERGSLVAVVEAVRFAGITPELLGAALNSIEMVEPLARRHYAVLAEAMNNGPVVPARLCTLFSNRESVVAALSDGAPQLLAALDRVTGRHEWGVRVRCDFDRLKESIERDALNEPPPPGASPGLAYLSAKRRAAKAQQIAEARLDEAAAEIEDELFPAATELRERPPSATPPGEPAMMDVIYIAALVEDSQEDAFKEAVQAAAERLSDEGFVFELSGPWVPFSFCADDAPVEASGADLAKQPGADPGAEMVTRAAARARAGEAAN